MSADGGRMKMARASEDDLRMALDLCSALDALGKGFMPMGCGDDEDALFHELDPHDCFKAMEHLLAIERRGSLFRVVFGMATVLDPRNCIVDQEDDVLELHRSLQRVRPLVVEAPPTIKGASIQGGYVVVTPAGWGFDNAIAVRNAIHAHFPVNPQFTPKPEGQP